jgi:hypothetical protein
MDPSLAQIGRQSQREAKFVSPNNGKWDKPACFIAVRPVAKLGTVHSIPAILGSTPSQLLRARRARGDRLGSDNIGPLPLGHEAADARSAAIGGCLVSDDGNALSG